MMRQKTLLVLAAAGLLVLGTLAQAGTITRSDLTTETDIVNLGGTLLGAYNFGGTGAVTVNGIPHVNSNSTYAPVNFSGPYGDPNPAAFTGDLFNLLDGIAGTANANEPGTLNVSGLTTGSNYLFQAYWIVKDNFATRRMNVTFEGDSLSNIAPNPNTSQAVLISYDFTAGDDTFNASFTGTGGDENGWICGFSLQSAEPLPPPTLAHRYSFTSDATDSVGSADLTLNGGATVTGGELDLPGGGTRVNNASATGSSLTELAGTINGASAITMETWFDQDTFTTWAKTFMAGDGTANYLDITPYRGNPGNPLGITINDAGHGETLLTDGSLAADTDYYVATIWDTITDTMSITVGPVGGTLSTVSGSMNGNLLSNIPITQLYLGSAVGFGDTDFNGQIDEFRIWRGALTSEQIAANFAAGPNFIPGQVIPEPSPFLIWAFGLLGLGWLGWWRSIRKPTHFTKAPAVVGRATSHSEGPTMMRQKTLLVLAAAGLLVLGTVAQGALTNRWSFSETGGAGTTLVDSVGGQNATIVDVGSNNGTVSGGQVTLAGGAKGSSDYVGLPAGLIGNGTGSPKTDVTIETWATQHSVQNWSRVWDFGQDTNNNFLMSWTWGTNINKDRVSFKIGSEHLTDDKMAPYTLDQEFHIVMTLDDDGGPNGETQVKVFKDGVYRGTINTSYNLSQLNDINNFLGRSQYPDNTANASWNELRIYDEELSESQILNNFGNGPDTVSLSSAGPEPLPAGPIHRWSFSETGGAGTTLVDSVGGANGTIVNVGGNDGTVGGGQVTLAGGAKGSSDYVDLPDGLVSGLTDATIETWATQHSVQNWSRIFDFGQDTSNNMLAAWTQGTNINADRAGMKVGNVEQSVDNMMARYELGREYHIVMSIDENAVGDGRTLLRLYKDGQLMGGRFTDYTLSQINDVNNWLGRSQYGDNTANASWNELRIYNYVLSDNQILGNFLNGPNAMNIIPEPGAVIVWTLLTGLGVVAAWGRRRAR